MGFGYHCSDPESILSRAPLHRPEKAVASRLKPPHSCAGKEGGPGKPEVEVLAHSAAQRGTRRRVWPRCLLGRPVRVSAGSWARPAAAPDARPRCPASPPAADFVPRGSFRGASAEVADAGEPGAPLAPARTSLGAKDTVKFK